MRTSRDGRRATRCPWIVSLLLAALLSAADVRGAWSQEKSFDPEVVVGLLELIIDADADAARRSLTILRDKILSREIGGEKVASLRERLQRVVQGPLADPQHALHADCLLLAGTWREPAALKQMRGWVVDQARPVPQRGDALAVLLAAADPEGLALAEGLLADESPAELKIRLLDELSRSAEPRVATFVLAAYEQLPGELRPRAVELLTQRPPWALDLLTAVEQGAIPKHALNASQLLKLQASQHPGLPERVKQLYGTVRGTRNAERERVIRDVRKLVLAEPGDPHRGWEVFRRVCGQCHRIHGEGQEVGPDVTRNGRASLTQLLSNVLDPSLVIGTAYQAHIIVTADGRVLTGLVAEHSPQRTILKMQGGKLELIPADDIDSMQMSPLSLMPEGLEKQLPPQELIDLFTFLRLDKPPTDPTASYIPDTDP